MRRISDWKKWLAGLALLSTASFAMAQTPAKTPDPLANLKFRNLGPAVGGGRVSAVAGIPGNPNVYYVGAGGGGVFKTTDGGNDWKAIFTHEATASVGAIALAPSNPSLIWVGTGESNVRNDVVTGKGVYFSPDAGQTWKAMGLADAGQISRIVINPHNPDEVWVAALGHVWGPNAERGVFHTIDGGKTWQKVLYVNDQTGAAELAMEPGNPKVLLAAMWQMVRYPWNFEDGGPGSGLYKSTDGGLTWTRLTKDLPDGPFGRIGLAFAPSDPQRVYALIEAKKGLLWRSDDLGSHWIKVSDNHALDVRPFYFSQMEVAPNDPDRIYFLSFQVELSTDGGHSAKVLGGDRMHPDNHAIWIDPRNPDRILEGNDGGAYLSLDAGSTWKYLNNLPIEQFYQVATDTETPYRVCGGLQDNNGWCGPSRSLNSDHIAGWINVIGGDGQYVVPAPSDPHILYADAQNAYIERIDTRTGIQQLVRPYFPDMGMESPGKLKYRFNWTSPIAVSRTNANEVYLGGNVLFKTTDGGQHWSVISPDLTLNDKAKQESSGGKINLDISGAENFDTILSIGLSPVNQQVIWVGTDDGLVQVTRDGGKSWSNASAHIAGLPKYGRVQQIEPSPFDAATCYVAFDFHELDNNRPYVYKTGDYGRTWTAITAGLPDDTPVRVVREDPNQKGFLVAGGDTGLFYSHDDGAHWTALKSNFPTAPVYDIKFVKANHDLVVATHGRGLWVMDNITALENLTPQVEAQTLHLFPVPAAVNYSTWNTGAGTDLNDFRTPNPPNGAAIDYSLKSEIKVSDDLKKKSMTPVKITITDAKGHLVNTFYGPSKQGVNRAVWGLSYEGPLNLDFGSSKAASQLPHTPDGGPAVLPGRYQVTVTIKGQPAQSQWVTVEADPRFQPDLAGWRATIQAMLEVSDDLSALDAALNRANRLKTQLGSLQSTMESMDNEASGNGYAPVLTQAKELDKKLGGWEATVYDTRVQRDAPEDDIHYLADLRGQVMSLFYSLSSYATSPTEVLLQAKADYHAKVMQALEGFNHLLSNDVAAFNHMAAQHEAGTLVAGQPVEVKKSSAGE